MTLRYDFASDVVANELQGRLDTMAQAGWRVHSVWQRVPDPSQVRFGGEPLVVYDVLFEHVVD